MAIQEKKHDESPATMTKALSEAQSVIEAAEQRAAELQKHAEQAYRDAGIKGFQEGFAEGLTEASIKAVRLIEETSRLQESLAHEAARLAIAIAATVVGEHVKVTPEAAKKIALKALRESVIGNSVVIVVHPEDESVVRGAEKDFQRVTEGANIGFESDDSIARGGCVVRTEFGEVDARIETMLASIKERLGLNDDAK